MSRPKDPNRVCGYDWGGTPNLKPVDSGWKCPHVCRLTVAEHGEYHECCNTSDGKTEV